MLIVIKTNKKIVADGTAGENQQKKQVNLQRIRDKAEVCIILSFWVLFREELHGLHMRTCGLTARD
jgi:hypothetical protein